jgi:hypothetical protein
VHPVSWSTTKQCLQSQIFLPKAQLKFCTVQCPTDAINSDKLYDDGLCRIWNNFKIQILECRVFGTSCQLIKNLHPLTNLWSSQRLLSINHLLNSWSLYLTQAQFQKPITFTTFLACIPPLPRYPDSNPCKLIQIPYWKPVDTSRDLHCVFSSYHCIPKLHTKRPQKESLPLAPSNLTEFTLLEPGLTWSHCCQHLQE